VHIWAIVALAVYTVANASLFHFQRFTFGVARTVAGELQATSRQQVRLLQALMTPTIVTSLTWVANIVLAVAVVFAFRAWGVAGAGAFTLWALASGVLAGAWPIPDRRTCVRIASAELENAGKLSGLDSGDRELLTAKLHNRLRSLAA